jgi:3-hydroxy-9,10-secoandrosta-1,3,5(10)-triene-9,17-dione monooxygenase reductase component
MRHAGRFAIHILEARHGGFARRATPPGADRFADPEVLREAIASFDCDLAAEHGAGDHWIVVGRVRAARVATGAKPLVYFGGRFGGFQPG